MRVRYTGTQALFEFSVFICTYLYLMFNYIEFPFIWRFLAAYGAGEIVGFLYYSSLVLANHIVSKR